MDTQKFLDNFGAIAESPGGIDRLRQLILKMAVTGRLVPQDPSEPGALEALELVRETKGPKVKAKVSGRLEIPRIPEEWESLFPAPTGWCWARLDDLGEYVNGLAFNQATWSDRGLPIIRIQNLTNPRAEFNFADGDYPEDRLVDNGDILVSWSATLEAFIWNRGPGVLNQHIFKVVPNESVADQAFLFHLLRHSIRRLADSDAAHGLAMKHINRGPFVSLPVALPPLGEQRRIAAKVDELMRQCDALEAEQFQMISFERSTRGALLNSLLLPRAQAEAVVNWNRVAANWPSLINSVESVEKVERLALALAVRGRLAPQNPQEESGADVVARINQENLVRPSKSVDLSSEIRRPWEIPSNWSWVRFGSVVEFKTGKTPPTKDPAMWASSEGVPWATITDMPHGGVLTSTNRTISRAAVERTMKGDPLPVGTILMSFKLTLGKICRLGVPAFHNEAIISIAAPFKEMDEYLFRFLPLLVLEGASKGAIKGMTLNATSLANLPIPIPPLREQARIVHRIDQIAVDCQELRTALGARIGLQRRLAEAAVGRLAGSAPHRLTP